MVQWQTHTQTRRNDSHLSSYRRCCNSQRFLRLAIIFIIAQNGLMSTQAINWARDKKCPTPSTKLILFMLANYARKANHTCYPSEKHLAEICSLSDRQVRRCIATLVRLDYVTVQKRKGFSNLYTLRVDTNVQRVRTPKSPNTLNIQKRSRLNAIAG